MEWKITKANISKNFALYRMYLISAGITLSILVAFLTFLSDDIILEKINISTQASIIANGSLIFLVLFLIIYFSYLNNFFIKRKSRELGILSLLGFSKKKLLKLLTLENFSILAIGYILALLIGPLLYVLVEYIVVFCMSLDISVRYIFSFDVLSKTLVILLVAFVINGLVNYMLLRRYSLVEFTRYSQREEKRLLISKWGGGISIIVLFCGYLLCLDSLRLSHSFWVKIGILPVGLLTLLLIVLGSVSIIRYGIVFIITLLKQHKKLLYRSISNITYPKLTFRIGTKRRLLTILTGLVTLTVAILGIAIITITYTNSALNRLNPSTIEYKLADENGIDISKISQKFKVNPVDVHLLRIDSNPDIIITDSGQTIGYFDLISYSDYVSLMTSEGKSKAIVPKDSLPLLINYYPTKNSLGKDFNLEGNHHITIKTVSSDNILSFASSVTTLIVEDDVYKKLSTEFRDKEFIIRTFNKKSLRNSESFFKAFETVEDFNSSYERQYDLKSTNTATYIFIVFLCILFVVTTVSVLYFTSIIEIVESNQEYHYLNKLGYNKRQIKQVINREIGLLFMVPIIMGIVNGSLLLVAYRSMLVDNFIASSLITGVLIVGVAIFVIAYYISYLFTRYSAWQTVGL